MTSIDITNHLKNIKSYYDTPAFCVNTFVNSINYDYERKEEETRLKYDHEDLKDFKNIKDIQTGGGYEYIQYSHEFKTYKFKIFETKLDDYICITIFGYFYVNKYKNIESEQNGLTFNKDENKKMSPCVTILIGKQDSIANISNVIYYDRCFFSIGQCKLAIPPKPCGQSLMQVALELISSKYKKKYNIKQIRLKDFSKRKFTEFDKQYKVEIPKLYTLIYGNTFYGNLGFKPNNTYKTKIVNNILSLDTTTEYNLTNQNKLDHNKKIIRKTIANTTKIHDLYVQLLKEKHTKLINHIRQENPKLTVSIVLCDYIATVYDIIKYMKINEDKATLQDVFFKTWTLSKNIMYDIVERFSSLDVYIGKEIYNLYGIEYYKNI